MLNKPTVIEILSIWEGIDRGRDQTYSRLRGILAEFDWPGVRIKTAIRFRFPFYMTDKIAATDIEALELSVRSYNCLKRMGYNTIGSLVRNVQGYADLKKIRNCGRKSIDVILEKLFCYQYSLIAPEKRGGYIAKLKELNGR